MNHLSQATVPLTALPLTFRALEYGGRKPESAVLVSLDLKPMTHLETDLLTFHLSQS